MTELQPSRIQVQGAPQPENSVKVASFKENFLYITLASLKGCRVRVTATFKKEKLSNFQQRIAQESKNDAGNSPRPPEPNDKQGQQPQRVE